ncbi:MAG: hypothetical protein EA359_16730 [Balneolaceae bacterium]|nr:MAG: hypothetical protein EA359_16730 [Balneolaceae bacterium]
MHIKKAIPYFKKSDLNVLAFAFLIMLAFVFVLSGCDESSTGVNNNNGTNGNGNGNGNGGNEIGTSPTFDNVGQIFLSYCADCHTSIQESGVRLNTYTNVIESVGDQYGRLVVQPGDAANSPLVEKIESSNPSFGVRMPEDGPYLSSQRIDQIKEWINDGAENNQSNDESGGNSGGNDGGGGY